MMRNIIAIASLAAFQAAAQQAACPGFENCEYKPNADVAFTGQEVRLSYTDLMGLERSFEVWVRIPAIRTGALPVMIWAHGGGDGRTDGSADILTRPSELTASAGWLTVSPAFRPRTDAEQRALCDYLELPNTDEEPCTVNSPTWDRPFDIQAVIALLRRENQRPASPIFGRVDMSRLAVGGHSAGSSATLSVAGGYREIRDKRFGGPGYFEDPTPVAFIALSNSAPGRSSNFDTQFGDTTTTWSTIKRPVLMMSGAGDAHEQAPHGRYLAYEHLPEADGTHYRYWFEDTSFGHGQFGEDPCELPGAAGKRKCDVFLSAWGSTIMAFLDAYVNKTPRAIEYLNKEYSTRIPGTLFSIEASRK